MGYYAYLCDLLRPMRIYRLERESISGAELFAAGAGLDEAALALETAEREGLLATAEDEGLCRREALFAACPAAPAVEERRPAIAALENIGVDGFTLAAVNAAITGCGIRALAEETENYGVVRVSFPGVGGEPENFATIERIVLDIMPCHLETEFFFRYMTWEECEAIGFTWETVEQQGHTWESFQKAVGDA